MLKANDFDTYVRTDLLLMNTLSGSSPFFLLELKHLTKQYQNIREQTAVDQQAELLLMRRQGHPLLWQAVSIKHLLHNTLWLYLKHSNSLFLLVLPLCQNHLIF